MSTDRELQLIIERDVCLQMEDGATFFDYGYSGRGMMGRKCVAIHGTHDQCKSTIAQIIFVLHTNLVEAAMEAPTMLGVDTQVAVDEASAEFYNRVRTLMNFDIDSMGYEFVYYWQELEFEEPAESSEN